MEIYMQKIGLIRDDINPRNSDLNLDIDWYVEYTNADQDRINFNIVLKSCENFNLNFKVEGILKLDLFEEFIQDECSQVIFYHACNVLDFYNTWIYSYYIKERISGFRQWKPLQCSL